MCTTTGELSASTDPDQLLPEIVQLTAATIRGWRKAGYRVREERVAPWLILQVHNSRESAIYRVVGPSFQGQSTTYLGVRVA
jgi:hypothetical protein